MIIRQLDLERDAADCTAIYQEVTPYTTAGVESWLHNQRTTPERAQHGQWVAEVNGRVVGFSFAGLKWFSTTDSAYASASVLSSHRRHGIGAALWERADDHLRALGVTRVTSMFVEEPRAVAFAHARGFAEDRAESLSAVEPTRVQPPDGDVVPLAELDPRDVYAVDEATTPDVPMSDQVGSFPYDEWLEGIWRRPAVTHEGSFGALVDGRLAAFTLLAVNRDLRRGYTEYTATLREFRGLGLAERVKRASLSWAAANGIERVWTTNDERNAPMLRVNERLGYVMSARRVEYVRSGS